MSKNPFEVLNVSKDASSRDIILAAATALREKRFSAKEIALSQKALLDPLSREETAFIHLDNEPSENPFLHHAPQVTEKTPSLFPDLVRLDIFD